MKEMHRRFFEELTPFANAIRELPPANVAPSAPVNKLGDAQRKREAKAAKRLAQQQRGART